MSRSGRSGDAPFGRRTALVMVAAAAALAVTLFFAVFGAAPAEVLSAGPDGFSRSAVGSHALLQLLEETGASVHVSRYATLDRLRSGTGLLLLQPSVGGERAEETAEMIAGAVDRRVPVVVVLPKWHWRVDPEDPARVDRVELRPAAGAERLLGNLIEEEAEEQVQLSSVRVVRRWDGTGRVGVDGPLAEGLRPVLERPQTLPADLQGFAPLLSSEVGTWVAYDPDRRLTIVSDPDLFNTYGLGRGDNARLAYRLLVRGDGMLGSPPRIWIVDETLHGHERVPSLFRELLELPLVLFTLQTVLLAVLAVWAAAPRFGAPLPPPPRLPAGAGALIDNTAGLLALGGDSAEAADRYLDAILDDAETRLHLPPRRGRWQRVERLASLAAARGVQEDLEDVTRGVVGLQGARNRQAAPRAFDLARRLWRWREEVLHGSR